MDQEALLGMNMNTRKLSQSHDIAARLSLGNSAGEFEIKKRQHMMLMKNRNKKNWCSQTIENCFSMCCNEQVGIRGMR